MTWLISPRKQTPVILLTLFMMLSPLANREAQPQPSVGSTAPRASAESVDVRVVQNSSSSLTVHARKGELEARLSVLLKDNSLGFTLHRGPGHGTGEWPWFAEIAPLLQACLRTVVPEPDRFPGFRFMTRLAMYPEMSGRIALQAGTSKKWDHRFGRPRASFTNNFVLSLAVNNDTYPELNTLFASHQYQIQLVSLERVSIAPVHALPYHDILVAEGLSPQWLVPYDAILHFQVKHVP